MKKAFKSALSLLLCMIMIIGTLIPTIAAKGNDSSQAAIEQDGLRLESTNAVGKVLAKAASEQTAQQSGDYGIIDVEIAGNIVNVQINNEESCTVVVAVYDDDTGRMIGSGFCDAEKDADIVDVELNVSEVPEYYLLRVFLIDSQKAALCEEYRYIEHTHNFIDAKSKTVDDFPDNVVLNLDESKTNNFAVVADEGIEITTDGVKNILASSENDVYTFNNIDSQFDSLKVGDVISYTDGEQNSIVIKISSVKIQGNTAVIGSDADATIDELFSFLKIDNEFDGDGDKMSVDMTGVEEGIVYEGMEKFDEEQQSPAKAPQKSKVDVSSTLDCPVWKISKKFGYMGDGSGNNTGTATIEFKFEIKVSASYSLKAYYDADWEWKWDFWNSYSSYYFFETVFEFNAKGTGSVTGTLSKEFYLGSITFVTPCGITCGVGFRLVFAASGSISLDLAKLSFKIGFRFDKDSGFKNLSSKPKIELIPTLKSELSVSLSLKVSPSVSLIKVMEVAINPEIGIKVSGTPFSLNPVDKITGKPDESKVHACNVCIDGSIKLFRTVSLTGRFFGKKKSSTLVPSSEWTVSKFYYSASTGKLEFGKTCPNILYCVTFTVVGKDGKALEGASVNIGDGALYKFENGKPVKVGGKVAVTDDKGVAKAYYANGKHTATASKDNSEYSVSFTVMNAEKELKVKLNVAGTGGGTNPNPNPGGETDPTPTPGILNKLTYEIENGEVTITDCDTSLSGDIVLPSKIEGKPVTSIGDNAFVDCSRLTSVTIGNGVTSIGSGAFYNCSGLTSITIPNSVTSIGEIAFMNCSSLASITIPNSDTSIGTMAFCYCSSLTSITIPDSVTSIGDEVFGDCEKLTQINVDKANTVYSSVNGVLFNKNKTELIRYPAGKADTSYSIPDSVTSIGIGAFNCSSLTSITIPNSVTSIGNGAFYDCDNLASITIPDSVTSIGEMAFRRCSRLTSVTIGNSVTSIGNFAFEDCSSLTSITIPDSVTSIGVNAFGDCEKLTQINVDTANTVYSSVNGVLFNKGKTELIRYPEGKADTSYFIPNSVTSIGNYAFDGCSKLNQINVDTANTAYSSMNGVLFDKDKTELIRYPKGKTETSYTIPDGVTSIGYRALKDCKSLTSITIPDSVTSIGGSAFENCSSLTSITIPDGVTCFGNDAFLRCSSLKDVYYSGTQEQWEKISIYDYSGSLTSATIHYGSSAPAANAKAMRAPAAPAAQSTVYTATAQNAVPGELYMLYAFSSGTDLSSLEYVAQLRADSGEVKFRYIPRNSGELNVIIVGKFGDGSVQEPVEPEYGVERLELISPPAKTEYDYLSSPVVKLKGLRLKAVYSDSTEKEITDIKSITASKVDTSKLGDQEITLTYEGVSIQIAVTVVPRKFKLVWIVDGSQTELTAAEGSKITKPADPELEGYDFMGWSPEVPETMPAQNMTFTAVFEPIKTKISINTPSVTTVSYGFTLNLHANVTDLPDGARIVWSMDGSGFELIPSSDGMTCGVKSVSKGSATITARVVDKNGNAVKDANGNEITASQQLTSKAGFFQKLIAFFKKLFGSNMIIPYALEWIVK